MGKKRRRTIKWSVISCILLLVLVCILSGMHRTSEKKKERELRQEIHPEIAELEQYVYDNVGPDIYFGEPEIDEDELTADLYLLVSGHHQNSPLFDQARCSINDFLENNPEYYINSDYRINLHYGCRINLPHNDYDDYYDGLASNYTDINGYTSAGYRDYHLLYDSISCISCQCNYKYTSVYNSENVRVLIVLGIQINIDKIIEIASNNPDLEYIYISSWDGDIQDITEAISELYPQITVIRKYNR